MSWSQISRKRGNAVLKCPPCKADEDSFKFQNPFIITSSKFPANDKMDQRHVGLNTTTLDEIIDKVFRGTVETRACFRDAASETQDRIHMGALFPGFRYVIPGDRDMVAETTGVTYLVAARDAKGDVILGENGQPELVECLASDLCEFRNEDKRWRCGFKTKLRNPALSEFLKAKHQDPTDFWQIASVIEAKWMMSGGDIYQAGASGCNELVRELRCCRPVDRLYCYVWAKEEYGYGILDPLGLVRVLNHRIDPASFQKYLENIEETKKRLGDNFPTDSLNKLPQSLEGLQALYDVRKDEFEARYTAQYPKDQELLVGVFYRDTSMSRKMVTGKLSTELTDAYKFIQGFMRVHLGNEFLAWTPTMVETTFRHMLMEIRMKQREFFKSRCFERNMLLYLEELKTPTETWQLNENDDAYLLTFNIPHFRGRVSLKTGPIQRDVVTAGLEVLRIYGNATLTPGECSLDIVFPFSSLEIEGIAWDANEKVLVIRLPRKVPLLPMERPVKRMKLLPEQHN